VTRDRLASTILVVVLAAVGSLGWWLQLRPGLEVDASALAALPEEIPPWWSQDVALDEAVEAELRADLNLQRVYADATGEPVWLYIGYYGTSRGGRPEHTPRGCYTGAGWSIDAERRIPTDPSGARHVNEYVVSRNGARQLVHFWFRSHRRSHLLGGIDQNWDRLVGRLGSGRSDGALVRLSADVTSGDEVGARSRLLAFGARLDPLLGERWPVETPR